MREILERECWLGCLCVWACERERREAKYDTLSVAYLRLFCKTFSNPIHPGRGHPVMLRHYLLRGLRPFGERKWFWWRREADNERQ